MNIPLYPVAAASGRAEEQAYDDAPYESNAFGQSHPARIAAIAHLLGLDPPPVETARVLELGCASGGNLIPLALHFARAHFTGVDISGRQIASGAQRAARLGLKNIELRHAGIESLTAADGKFDYIICHGVYSWVPEPVRDALLRVCGENLADGGIAFVSYNTLPGWHFVQPVRDLMLYWTQDIVDPAEKSRVAREVLGSVKDIAAEPAGNIYRKEADTLRPAGASYVLHDHLELHNAPCYLKDFVAHAERHALAYLGDAAFTLPGLLESTPLLTGLAEKYAAGDIVRAEQLLDFLRNRRFRETLLVRKAMQPLIRRSSALERLDGLHFRLVETLHKDPPIAAHMAALWCHPETAIYRTRSSAFKAQSASASKALAWLAGRGSAGATFTLRDLTIAAGLAAETETDMTDGKRHLAALVWELLGSTTLRAYACAIRAPTPGRLPMASALALADAALGAASTSNVFHEHVKLGDIQRRLLQLLDGKSTPAQLVAGMQEQHGSEKRFSAVQLESELESFAENHLLC
ncbi:MAG: methyltransferase domain-containing protein [Comamonadaceae bacterium]|nr:MAG: methyltransferase domain-containing protein [Comamonadaceae bacterium]